MSRLPMKRLFLVPILGGLAGYEVLLLSVWVPALNQPRPWLRKKKGRS